VSQCFGYDPCLFRHSVHLQCKCDFQLAGFYPCFKMSCYGGPHFSYAGWRVGCACDRWWLFSLLWLLCLGHICFDLPCCFSGLYLSSGGVDSFVEFGAWFDLSWFEGELVIRFGFRGSMVSCIEKPRVLVTTLLSSELDGCHPYGLVWGGAYDLPGFEGELVLFLYIVYFTFLLHFLCTHLSHIASHVILACICLIMLIIVLGLVLMRCEPFC
jgi:hypothetical protein